MRRLLNVGRGYPPRLLAFVLATLLVGVPLVAGAARQGLLDLPSTATAVGVGVFFLLALLAELRPIPIDIEGERLISLAFVFVVASRPLFGWEWSVLIGAGAIGVAMLPHRPGLLKLSFNSAVYGISAAVASLPNFIVGSQGLQSGYGRVTVLAVLSGGIFVAVNVVLVCIAMALASGAKVRGVLADHLRHSGSVFSIMAFIAAQVVIFWHLSPFLLILVGAPLFTLNLYQRSAVSGRVALKQASTDSLTGLKNHRAFQEDIAATLERALAGQTVVTLCLVDVDRFKHVNDRHGHPVGDAVLKMLGGLVEELVPGRGYRLGGDELQRRLAEAEFGAIPEVVTFSCGIASCPKHALDAAALKTCADLALYQSKNEGRNRFCVFDPRHQELTRPALYGSRLHAAEKLVALVDARDAYVGRHSAAVAQVVDAIGRTLGLGELEVQQLRIAGLLHDLGKIGVPDKILNKPSSLDAAEDELMMKHPQFGFDLLDGYDLAPIDMWILHHHERWDGGGYPVGLAGEQIPFGSRIILVADAFEAMTTERAYAPAISAEAAMQELREHAGTQFDPRVVDALDDYLAVSRSRPAPAPGAVLPAGIPAPAWSS
jgi:HD-GYP domain-containing protein (c-di-GMP phosphodiesterase class II)